MSHSYIDRNSILDQLRKVVGGRQPIFELRCINQNYCRSGLFNDLERLADSAFEANQSGANCFVSLNQIRVEPSRINNTLGSKAISAQDIERIESILIDVDPIRPSNCASSEEEKRAASEVLKKVLVRLNELGWPAPAIIDSGNGYHAIYSADIPNEQGSLVKTLLDTLAWNFNNESAKVDVTVADPSRVTRLPGTMNYKGTESNERPHRIAKLLKEAKRDKPITADQLGNDIQTLTKSYFAEREIKVSEDDLEEARHWLSTQRIPNFAGSNDKVLSRLAASLVIDLAIPLLEAIELMQDFRDERQIEWDNLKITQICRWACSKIPGSKDRFGKRQVLKRLIEDESKKSDADRLVELVLPIHRLSYTGENETYASVPLPTGGVVNLRITSIEYRNRLTGIFYETFDKIPSSLAMTNAIETLSGQAVINGQQCETRLRIASNNGKTYIDIGDAEWNCITIDETGWRLGVDPPVLFRRGAGFDKLPIPDLDGNIGPLIEFLNVGGENDFILMVAFLLIGFNCRSEYPVLLLYGEQGTSKSTTAMLLRSLLDPNIAPLRNNPRNDDDFATAGYNNHVVVFDNLSYIDGNLSDNLCRMSTGATLSKRQQYTNRDEVLVRYKNLVILNGITELAQRPDLLNRAITIDLPKIQKRRSSKEFWDGFSSAAPKILGGLLDAVAYAMANPTNTDAELPRMAEFCRFVMSAEPELARQWNEYIASSERTDLREWKVGDFYQAYMDNIDQCSVTAVEQIPFLRHLETLLKKSFPFPVRLPATELLTNLKKTAESKGEDTKKGTGWPQSGTAMGSMLQRLVPIFRELGISASRERKSGGNRERNWVIEWIFPPEDLGECTPRTKSLEGRPGHSGQTTASDNEISMYIDNIIELNS